MLSQPLSNELGWVLLHAIGCMQMPSSSTLSSTLQVVNTFIVCLFHEIENENEVIGMKLIFTWQNIIPKI